MITSISSNPYIRSGLDTIEDMMLSQVENYHPDLKAAVSIILSSGGKRLRPILILLIGKLLNARKEDLITLATSIELLHTATLVHDDLIDGSLLRRGIPTLNSKWSPAATVLTGDFIFASAADMAARTNSLEVMTLFARTLMTIVNGEVNQLFNSKCMPGKDEYFQRIYEKTASLFETSTHSAAILSGVNNKQRESIKKFGYELGMAFQIIDDILDYRGDESTVGKPIGGDLRQGLITLPMIYFIQDHPENQFVVNLLEGKCSQDDEEIQNIVHEVNLSGAIEKAFSSAEEFINRARDYILEFPDCEERESLLTITRYTLDRKK